MSKVMRLPHSLKILFVFINVVALSFFTSVFLIGGTFFQKNLSLTSQANAATLVGTFERVHTDLTYTSRTNIVFISNSGIAYDASGLTVSPSLVGKTTTLSNAAVSGTTLKSASLTNTQTTVPRREPYLGALSVSVVPFYFSDSNSITGNASGDQSYIQDQFTQVAKYYEEASYGKATLSMKFYDPVRIDIAKNTPCDETDWYNWIEQVKKKHQSSVFGAKIVAFIFPRINGCNWEGRAIFKTDSHPDYILVHGTTGSRYIAHEFGHVVGSLGHAGTLNCGSRSIDTFSKCIYSEGEDPFDVMSGTPSIGSKPLHFNAANKILGKYITGTQNVNFSGSKEYRLDFVEDNTGSNLAIVIPKQDTSEVYVLTHRKRYGFDNNDIIPTSGAVFLHILANPITEDDKKWSDRPTVLLDVTPGDNKFLNAYFTDGLLFCDPINKISIKQVSHTSNFAILDIRNNSSCLNSNTVSTTPQPSLAPIGSVTPRLVDIGGFVWDSNLNVVPNVQMIVEDYRSGGWAPHYVTTGSGGFFKQGGTVAQGQNYQVRSGDGKGKTLTLQTTRDYGTGQDTVQGSSGYMMQKSDFYDCSKLYGDATFRCNFLYMKPVDTAQPIYDVTAFIWHPTANNEWKHKYRRILIAADGRTYYGKNCDFHTLIGYPQVCGGYYSGTLDTPGPVRGYGTFLYTANGKTFMKHYYVGSDTLTTYTRDCEFDQNGGSGNVTNCTQYITGRVDTPTGVRDVTAYYHNGDLLQGFISVDGNKYYFRYCKFDAVAKKVTSCEAYRTAALPATMNGYAAFHYRGGYNNEMKLQQYMIGGDGRKPYFRTCGWKSISEVSCPGFIQ